MLKAEIVEAVQEGKFHIYPVDTIDQGIEILTGVPAGERGEDGTYPEGSVNWAVEKRLAEFAEGLKAFRSEKETEAEKSEDEEEEPTKPDPTPAKESTSKVGTTSSSQFDL